jgi:hypothetical protein
MRQKQPIWFDRSGFYEKLFSNIELFIARQTDF